MARIRVGVVGAGGVSKLHTTGIGRHSDEARVVALCDPDEGASAARAAECGDPATYTDLAAMIDGVELDAAVVCTPTSIRSQVVLPLIAAGIPTLCEKPFAETYAEAAEMEAAARESGVALAVNQNFRRSFPFAMARDILAKGDLGRPLHLAQTVLGMRKDKGWRLERSRYVMAVMSVHWFDGYRFMLRDEPESVYCRAVNSPATPGGDDTAISAVLSFGGGTVASLSESFSSFARQNVCSLDCERGALVLTHGGVEEIHADGDKIEHANAQDREDGSFHLIADLVRAAREGREPETSATDNLKTMRILEAAYRSANEGRVVRLEEIG